MISMIRLFIDKPMEGAIGMTIRASLATIALLANTWAVLVDLIPLILALPFIVLAIMAFAMMVIAGQTRHGLRTQIRHVWMRPAMFFLFTALVAIPSVIGATYILHQELLIAPKTGSTHEAKPWRQNLPAQVWWSKPPSPELEQGLIDTATIFRIPHQRVQSPQDANLRVHVDSWAYGCKWLTPLAFASPETPANSCGGQQGDICLCAFDNPSTARRIPKRSIIAHEAAHIFAAQPHFGDGLMAEGGGKYATWFTEEETRAMLTKVETFRREAGPECVSPAPIDPTNSNVPTLPFMPSQRYRQEISAEKGCEQTVHHLGINKPNSYYNPPPLPRTHPIENKLSPFHSCAVLSNGPMFQ